jgi:hypothetical protein
MTDNKHIKKLLELLGAPTEEHDSLYCCPLHSKTSFTLSFIKNNILPCGYHVKCMSGKCGFSGTVVDLIRAATDKSRSEVLSMFLEEGPLYDTFIPSRGKKGMDRSVIENYLLSLSLDVDIKNYLARCKNEFLMDSEMRAILSGSGILEEFFTNLSLGLYDRLLPDELASSAPKTRDKMLVLPYTCGGMVTSLELMNPVTGSKSTGLTVMAEGEYTGIYQENMLSEEGTVYVFPDELSATLAASKYSEFTNKPPNVVCFSSPEAMSVIDDNRDICLVSLPDRLLQVSTAASYWLAADRDDRVHVVELPGTLARFAGNRLPRVLSASIPATKWIAGEIARINSTKSLKAVKDLVATMSLSKRNKNRLLSVMKEYGHTDPLLLNTINNARLSGTTISYNKYTYTRTQTKYVCNKGVRTSLSNFVFYAETATKDESGKMVIVGNLKPDSKDIPLCKVRFRTNDLLSPYGAKLTEMIWGQLQEQGYSFTPFAADLHGGATWFNLITGFDSTDFKSSVFSLGAKEYGVIDYPNVTIDTRTKSMSGGNMIYGVDRQVCSSYSEIIASRRYDRDAMRDLMENDSKLLSRFFFILGHLMHQTVVPIVTENRFVPRHLVIPFGTEDDIWHETFIQTSAVFSGTTRVTRIPSTVAQFNKFVKHNAQLVTLPGIYAYQENSALSGWLYSTENSNILLAPGDKVGELSKEESTYFINEDFLETRTNTRLSHEVMDLVRAAWPHLVMSFVDRVDVTRDTCMERFPALIGLEWLADEMEATLPKRTFGVSPHHTVGEKNDLNLFLSIMSKNAHAGRLQISNSRRAHDKRKEATGSFMEAGNIHFLPDLCVPMANEVKGACFDARHLRAQTSERGWSKSRKYHIIVPLDYWSAIHEPGKGKVLTKEDLKLTLVS